MEIVSTKEAAEALGVSVQRVHRAATELGLTPALKLPGLTGAKLWTPEQVDAVRAHLAVAS